MNPFTSFCLRHLRAIVFLAAILAAAGVFAVFGMRRELEPFMRARHAVITAALPGASAAELADAVARPIEDLCAKTPGIRDFHTTCRDGVCVCVVDWDGQAAAMPEARERLRGGLAALREDLGRNIVGLAGPALDDRALTPGDLLIALPGDLRRLRETLPGIKRALAALPSVAGSESSGLPADQVTVEYLDKELADAGISPAMLCGLLKTQSFLAPGGYLDDGAKIACLRTDARLKNSEDIGAIFVLDPVTGKSTTLDRLLTVRREERSPPAPAVCVKGAPGILLSVSRRPGARAEVFSREVRAAVSDACAQAQLPAPLTLYDGAADTAKECGAFAKGLGASALIVLLLLVAALGLRTGSVVALSLPLVILSSLAVLALAGFTINLVTLGALTIAAGIVTDSHIVVAQALASRYRRLASAETCATSLRPMAVNDCTRMLAGPLLAATLAALAGFLPVMLADHAAAEYLADLVPVVGVALFFSYLYAFTLTPFLCPVASKPARWVAGFEAAYARALGAALRRPMLVLAGATLITAGGLFAFFRLPASFFPGSAPSALAIELFLPADASQTKTAQAVKNLEKKVAETLAACGAEGGASWMTQTGRGLPRVSPSAPPAQSGFNCASALIAFDTPAHLEAFRHAFDFKADGVRWRVRPFSGGPQADWPVRIALSGEGLEKALPIAEKILGAQRGFINLHREDGGEIAKWSVVPKRRAAADKAVTPADIAMALNVCTHGLPAFDLGSGEDAIPVVVQPKKKAADLLDNLRDTYVYPQHGLPVLMDDVGEVVREMAPAAITRHRGEPCVSFAADCAGNPYALEEAQVADLRLQLAQMPGVRVDSNGLAQSAREANAALLKQVPAALAFMALVLLLLTRSFKRMLLVLCVIPLGVAGAGFGLWLFGMPSGFMPIIGLCAMAGIAVNVTVVMMAALMAKTAPGATAEQVVAGAAERVEPVLLSLACALCGVVPLYLFGGELWSAMAVALGSSLILATAVAVFVVPVAFHLMERKREIHRAGG